MIHGITPNWADIHYTASDEQWYTKLLLRLRDALQTLCVVYFEFAKNSFTWFEKRLNYDSRFVS